MRQRLRDLLVCPIDKEPLHLIQWECSPSELPQAARARIERCCFDPASFSTEITTGVLINDRRKIFYPIYRGIPRMLVFPTALTREFARLYGERIARDFPGFKLPSEKPMPGEETVLRTFSSEWLNYDWDGQSYWSVSPEVMFTSMHFMLDLSARPIKDQLVLEVGVGIGGIADYMASMEGCEVVGIDVSYAIDPAYSHFGRNPFLHLVQASAFAPPFQQTTFDLVYSQGVLHHTFSTKTAFDCISKLPRNGGRLYVWLYSPYDEARNLERRVLMKIERVLRPLIAGLPERLQTAALVPLVMLYLLHQNLIVRLRDKRYAKYGWREAVHAARDRFTPRYAHRHSEEEVYGWFKDAGYRNLQSVSKRKVPDSIPVSFVTATAVDGVRQ